MLTKLEQISGMACISLLFPRRHPKSHSEKRKERGNPAQKERKVIVVGGLAVGQLLSFTRKEKMDDVGGWMVIGIT